MAVEIEEVQKFQLYPEGQYILTVESVSEKFRANTEKRTVYRKWKFKIIIDGVEKTLTKAFFPFNNYDLLIAVGGKETDKGIEIDYDLVPGKVIKAELVHVEDRNGNMQHELQNIESYSTETELGGEEW